MSEFLASIDAELVEMMRDAAKEVFGANCAFADDDLRLLKVCSKWAIQNGIPDDLNTEIIPRAKALHAGDPEWWHKGRPDKTKGLFPKPPSSDHPSRTDAA